MNCKSKLQIKGETITVLFKFSANFPVPHFIKNKSLSTRHNRATCSTVHEVRFSRIAAWKQQQLYNTRQSPVNWRKYVMIRMVRVLRAKIEPQSGSKLSHTHAPEPARSTTTATCGYHGLPWMHAMHAMHAWLAAKRTPSIKPMMSSASATRRWAESIG